MKLDSKKSKLIDYGFMVLILAIVVFVTGRLFVLQATHAMQDSPLYHNDMKAYILEMQGLDSGYSFPYPIFFWIGGVFHLFLEPDISMAMATLLLNTLSILITIWGLRQVVLKPLQERFKDYPYLAGILITLVAVSLHFVSMVFPPEGMYLPGIPFRYLGVFTPNPFHNATYMATRPFAILAFLWYIKLLPIYETGKVAFKDYVLFSVFLLLTTMTKPSFTIVLVGSAGLIMLYRMVRSKFQNFWPTIRLGVCFIPTFIDLLYQYSGVFVPSGGEEGGIGFGFAEVWSLYCGDIPLAIGLAAGFPILVLVLNRKEIKTNVAFRFSWQLYGMSLAMALILYEKGFRQPDFNFSWGYMHGIFFVFYGALVVLLQATANRESQGWKIALQWLAYLWHVVCGIYYFAGIANGAMYY